MKCKRPAGRVYRGSLTTVLGLLALVAATAALSFAAPAWSDEGDAGALAGLTNDGTIYLGGDDSFWHLIPDGATFKALGLDYWSITWYTDDLPGDIGDPLPAIAAPPAATPTPSAPAAQQPAARGVLGTTVALRPVIGKPAMVAAVAGKAFTVSFPIMRSDTGAKLTSGTAIANSSIGGKAIKGVTQFTKGTAAVRLTIPSTGKGKLLKVMLTVKVGSASASRLTTFHIG